jgi:hypothetical protein
VALPPQQIYDKPLTVKSISLQTGLVGKSVGKAFIAKGKCAITGPTTLFDLTSQGMFFDGRRLTGDGGRWTVDGGRLTVCFGFEFVVELEFLFDL